MKKIEITENENGVIIITEELPEIKSYTLGFWFTTGSRDEDKSTNGISHFIEHTIFKGTFNRSAKMISDEIENTGGYLNAFTSKEHTCYYGRGIAGSQKKMFSVLADMVQNPAFKENELTKEKGIILDELYDILDTPEEFIFDNFDKMLFGNNPLGMPIIGIEENIRNFNHQIVNEYFQNRYFSEKLLIVASGNIKHSELLELASKHIVRKYSDNINRNRKKPNKLKPKTQFIKHPINQYYSIVGTSSIGYTHTDYYKLRLLSIILGEGSSSRLFQALREKSGIAYQINTFVNSYSDVSAFGVYFSTNIKNRNKAGEVIYKEFQKILENGIKEKELSKARKIFIGNTILSLENTSNRMNRIANSFLAYGKIKPLEKSIEEVEKITSDEVITFAKKILLKEKLFEIGIEPEKRD